MADMGRLALSAAKLVALLGLVLAGGCAPTTASHSGEPGATSSAAVLDERLAEALAKYGEPQTNERLAEARSFLRVLRTGADACETCSELAVLERMLLLPADKGEITFEEAANFAVIQLVREELFEERS